MKIPQTLDPVIKITKYTIMDEVRQKSLIVMFVICAIFIVLIRGCYQGNFMVNGQALDAETIILVISKITFHVIAVGVQLLAALLAMRVFRRDRDDGVQSCILSKPIVRWQYVAGKILGLWALSTVFLFILHVIVFIIASVNLQTIMPLYLAASLICSFNLLFIIIAVLFLSLLMPDIAAFLSVLGIGIVGFAADGIFAFSHSQAAQMIMQQTGSSSDLTWWKVIYYLWPKLSGTQQIASSVIGSTGSPDIGSIYPLINVLIYIFVFGALLLQRFKNEDIM